MKRACEQNSKTRVSNVKKTEKRFAFDIILSAFISADVLPVFFSIEIVWIEKKVIMQDNL